MNDTVALFAGEGQMPIRVFEEMKNRGKKVLLIAVKGSTDSSLVEKADFLVFISIIELGKAIKALKKFKIKELTMVGRIRHTSIFSVSILKLDFVTLKLWFSLKDKRTDTILSAIGELLQKNGITLINSIEYLKKYVAKEGVLTKKKPSQELLEEIFFGVKIAKELGRLDVGQTIVVKHNSVVAVEAMEGTDACIERAFSIAGPSTVVIKMPKPSQDMRFDVPVIGLNTIEKLVKIKAAALAIESKRTVILNPECIALADKNNLVIVALLREETESS
jgi:DUF1009 family protein